MIFLRFSLTVTLASLVMLWSCGDDDGDNPNQGKAAPFIDLNINDDGFVPELNADVGDTITIAAEVTAEASLSFFKATYRVNGETTTIVDVVPDTATLISYTLQEFPFVVDFTTAGQTINFKFVARDTVGRSDSLTMTVVVNESPISTISNITAGHFKHESLGNLYNVLSDTLYFPANLKGNIKNQENTDFMFSYQNSTKWEIVSVAHQGADTTIWGPQVNFSWPFGSTNNTRFIALDTTDINFDQVSTAAQLEDLFVGSETTLVSRLYKGQVVAFKLAASKDNRIGLLRIKSLQGTDLIKRSVTFDMKIQN